MQTKSELPLTLAKKDFARHLGVSVRTLERLRQSGALPATVPGLKRPRWFTESVLDWLRGAGAKREQSQKN